jgi:hypothetical protein
MGKPKELAKALRDCPRYMLARVCWGLGEMRAKEFKGLPFDGWESFADTILEAGRHDPETMLPHIAFMIARTRDMSDGSTRFDYDAERAERLFGDVEALRKLFTSCEVNDDGCAAVRQALISSAA